VQLVLGDMSSSSSSSSSSRWQQAQAQKDGLGSMEDGSSSTDPVKVLRGLMEAEQDSLYRM
jgi:hypothetical protein